MRPIAVFEHDRQGEWTKHGGWTGVNGYTDSFVYVGDYDLTDEELKIIAPYNEEGTDSWFIESPTQWSDFVRDEISKERTKELVQKLGSDFAEANNIIQLSPIMNTAHQYALIKIKDQLEKESEIRTEWDKLKKEQNKLLGQFLSRIDILLYTPRLKEEQEKIMLAFKEKQYKFIKHHIDNHYFDLNTKIETRFLFLNELCGHLKSQIANLCSKYVQEKIKPYENGVLLPYRENSNGYICSYGGKLVNHILRNEKSLLITKELYPLDIALMFNDLEYFNELQTKGAKLTEYKNLYNELKRNEGRLR